MRIFLRILAATTFVLMLLGGWVHTVGASLACPDWPLCYGQVLPPMRGGILYEHGHRLLASLVGAMTLGLAWRLHAQGASPGLRRGSLLGLGLVLGQGLLGGLTVLLRLPPAVSILHLGTSMLFFAWTVWMQFRLHDRAASPSVSPRPAQLAAALLLVQIMLGAVVRHLHASLSCGLEVVRCAGSWLPQMGLQWLQTTHRLLAWGVLAALVWGTVPAMKLARQRGWVGLRRLGLALHLGVALQIVVGALTIKTAVNLHVVSTHLALAAGLWAGIVAFCCALGPLGWPLAPARGRGGRASAALAVQHAG